MNFINMLSPMQWLVMLAVPPLILLLYFLKLRRRPVVVPSTYLWKRSIEDMSVNSIWQRLKNNVLLILQLLVAGLILLSGLAPGCSGDQSIANRSILLIDHSASMQATDVGQSRLEEAKSRALKLVNSMSSSDVAMVIAFSNRAEVKQGFTSNKKLLRAAIDSIQNTNRTSDLHEALIAASGLANPGRTSQIEGVNDVQVAAPVPATMYILTDGGFDLVDVDLENLQAEFIPIGEETTKNVSISAFQLERNAEKNGQLQAFARIVNAGAEDVNVSLTLSLDGQVVDAVSQAVGKHGAAGVNFDLPNVENAKLQLHLDRDDELLLDNVAYASPSERADVTIALVTAGNEALEKVLATDTITKFAKVLLLTPEEYTSEANRTLARSGDVDLFMFDKFVPTELPESNCLFWGAIPELHGWKSQPASSPIFLVDSDKTHPIMQYIDLYSIRVIEGQSMEMPEGGKSLVRSDSGAIVGLAPRGSFQDLVIGFPLKRLGENAGDELPNTDWPIRRSFPVFVINVVRYLTDIANGSSAISVQPGQQVTLNVSSRHQDVDIFSPTGERTKLSRNGMPQFVFSDTEKTGLYEVFDRAGNLLQIFSVNLASERESDIAVKPDILIGAQTIQANPQLQVMRWQAWKLLLCGAIVILTVEWGIYLRRITV